MSIKRVLICGLGAIGVTFGSKILKNSDIELKILVDSKRLEQYTKKPPSLNGEIKNFDYIKEDDIFSPDLIIISTKSYGLERVMSSISNFINDNVIIISLINGISSEEIIRSKFPNTNVLKSYFIGHSAVRNGNNVVQDGVGEIVIEYNNKIIEFFDRVGIKYSVPDNIEYSMWLKFTFNLVCNQVSAILNMDFGELKRSVKFKNLALPVIKEIKKIAQKQGIQDLETLENDIFMYLDKMCDEGKTSMLQDILAKRKTEIDIFAGEIIRLGKIYEIETPYNQVFYDLIRIKEEVNEYCVYTG